MTHFIHTTASAGERWLTQLGTWCGAPRRQSDGASSNGFGEAGDGIHPFDLALRVDGQASTHVAAEPSSATPTLLVLAGLLATHRTRISRVIFL
ncbi:MAG: hypothetical protein IPP87_07550 [Ideonella sp.]|nr:hypothetical protein [Ideonella sp.]